MQHLACSYAKLGQPRLSLCMGAGLEPGSWSLEQDQDPGALQDGSEGSAR